MNRRRVLVAAAWVAVSAALLAAGAFAVKTVTPRRAPAAAGTTGVPQPPVTASTAGHLSGAPAVTSTTSPPRGSHLVFSDNFSGTTLNPSKWTTCYPWYPPTGCTNAANGELEWYLPQQVSVSGGELHLTAQRQPTVGAGHHYAYRSGLVTTYGRFAFTYGYVSFDARWPVGAGLWPGVWMLPTNQQPYPEIDILEANNRPAGTADQVLHTKSGSPLVLIRNLAPTWHRFALNWTPTSLTFYIDGKARLTVTQDVPDQPMYLLANLAVGGYFPGSPNQATPFPSSLDIKSVEVWQQ